MNPAYSNDQEMVSTALYPSELVKIIIPNLEPPGLNATYRIE